MRLRMNDLSLGSLYYQRLTESQLDRLHYATLEVLESIGVRFVEEQALDIFRKAGATVEDSVVKLPPALVEWALRTAPKHLLLYDQTGSPAIRLEGRVSYYGNGSDLLYIIDHRNHERRLAKHQDVIDTMRLLHRLDNLDFVMSGFLPRDVPVEQAETLQMKAMLNYTNKPIVYVVTDFALVKRVVEMAEVVAGGEEAFRNQPFAACYINIANPLRHNPGSIQKLIWLSEKGLPFTYRPALVTRGVSTPITGAGFLVVQNAAGLAGLVLSQLVREGAPFIRDACAGGTFDMQHMVGQQSPPEIRGFNEELLHYYGLPGFGIGGNTGAKTIDAQAALEAALSLLTSTQAGAHLVHDVGYMDNGVTGSLEFLAICDEIISWIKTYASPLIINEDTLGLADIREVVEQDGDFLGSNNTLKHFREDYYPRLLDRQNYDRWLAEGGTTMRERAYELVEEVLGEPEETFLTEEQIGALDEIIERDN
jgi:trimethylamine--corrinoid protein Co-methyltransferase